MLANNDLLCYSKNVMKIGELKDKKILILGLGKEGMDSFDFLRKMFPEKVFGLADRKKFSEFPAKIQEKIKKDKKTKQHFGENHLKFLKNYDVIIKAPGIPPKVLKSFLSPKTIVTSATEIFFDNYKGTIIGITGTKGKSTTSSLVYEILKTSVKKVHLVGNIGRPVLRFLEKSTEKDIFVYELSSHQLFHIKKSPHIAVFLNIFPEHLDYYKNFQEYIKAKKNITRWQTNQDYLIFNSRDKIVSKIAKKSKAKKISIFANNHSDVLKNIRMDTALKGEHNIQNIKASIAVAQIFKIPSAKITKAIKNFKPLNHRLEFVTTRKSVKFYNDSLSTIPEAAIAAIDVCGKDVNTIILGGYDRNLDFSKLGRRILKSKIKTVILFPDTGKRIWQEIQKQAEKSKIKNPVQCFFADNMRTAVETAFKRTRKGKICLLSPASPSFGLFKNYKERGNLFKKYIKCVNIT